MNATDNDVISETSKVPLFCCLHLRLVLLVKQVCTWLFILLFVLTLIVWIDLDIIFVILPWLWIEFEQVLFLDLVEGLRLTIAPRFLHVS